MDARKGLGIVLAATLVFSAALAGLAFHAGGTFLDPAPAGSAPPWGVLTMVPAVYDAADGYDLWVYPDGASWTYDHGAWKNITSSAGSPANMYANVRLVYDAADAYVLLYGGATRGPYGALEPLNETWKFQAGRWTNLTATVSGAPSPRLLGLMAYDSEDQEVVLFGGTFPGEPNGSSETWTYYGSIWTNATTSGPPPMGGAAFDPRQFFDLVDDPADGYVLYYEALQAHYCVPNCLATAWSFHGGSWTNLSGTPAAYPRLSLFYLFAWDSSDHIVVAEGACSSTAKFTCDHSVGTFTYTGGLWRDVSAAPSPSPREFASWVEDPSDGGAMVVGGCCWAEVSSLSASWEDVWIYAHGTWTESFPWGGIPAWWAADGTWMAVGLLAVAVVVPVLALRSVSKQDGWTWPPSGRAVRE